MEWLTTPEGWISLMTLTLLEIVLGIDNIVFISILASKLPKADQATARKLGLGMALVGRLCLLMGIAWIASLTQPLLTRVQILWLLQLKILMTVNLLRELL